MYLQRKHHKHKHQLNENKLRLSHDTLGLPLLPQLFQPLKAVEDGLELAAAKPPIEADIDETIAEGLEMTALADIGAERPAKVDDTSATVLSQEIRQKSAAMLAKATKADLEQIRQQSCAEAWRNMGQRTPAAAPSHPVVVGRLVEGTQIIFIFVRQWASKATFHEEVAPKSETQHVGAGRCLCRHTADDRNTDSGCFSECMHFTAQFRHVISFFRMYLSRHKW